eukprot:5116705-Pyramimonas_sp.AAC.1
MGLSSEIKMAKCHKTFRSGNDETATAKQQVTLPVWVRNAKRQLSVYLVPGQVSLLVARPGLEEWGMVIDYRNKKVMYLDEQPPEWIDLETNDKGHMIIDLLSFQADLLAADEQSSSTDADTDGDDK